MAGFIDCINRDQVTLFPDSLEDCTDEDHLARIVDRFVDELDLPALGFERCVPGRTYRPGNRPSVLLMLFIYSYLNRTPSSRRLERDLGRNVELMWSTGRLVPDHKKGRSCEGIKAGLPSCPSGPARAKSPGRQDHTLPRWGREAINADAFWLAVLAGGKRRPVAPHDVQAQIARRS